MTFIPVDTLDEVLAHALRKPGDQPGATLGTVLGLPIGSEPIQAAEYSVIKTYLDLMVSLPWQKGTTDNLDIPHGRQVLDEDHYGLDEIKERILEFLKGDALAVRE